MIDHSEILPRLAAFHDGALPEREQAAIGQHLEQCAECRARLVLWTALDSALKSLAIPELGESGPAAAALQRIESGRGAKRTPVQGGRPALRWRVWAGAAAAVLVLAASAAIWRGAANGPGEAPEVALAPMPGAEAGQTSVRPRAADPEGPEAGVAAPSGQELRAERTGESTVGGPPRIPGKDGTSETTATEDAVRYPGLNLTAAAPLPIRSEDSGIPQDPDWLARLAFAVDIHYRFYDRIDAAYVELNVVPLFEMDFALVGYARLDPLSGRWDVSNPEPTLLSPDDTYLVSNLRVERATLLALVTNQAPTSDVRVRLAEVTWRLAQITADQDDVRSAISAQTEMLRRNPEIDTQSRARLAYLRELVR